MTHTAEPAWGSTVDILADGLTTHETTDGNKPSGRNGGERRGAE